ncbi:hypothetical protein [Actinoplanes sp. RD1]|uniref:hypothetical protein n=1 Tax=Actinoplanes sp. RD1 TaxID=3064538 RepID=UPI0027422C2B|nr:hypothetical protein [Actinoplanes sp. RD1]
MSSTQGRTDLDHAARQADAGRHRSGSQNAARAVVETGGTTFASASTQDKPQQRRLAHAVHTPTAAETMQRAGGWLVTAFERARHHLDQR